MCFGIERERETDVCEILENLKERDREAKKRSRIFGRSQ